LRTNQIISAIAGIIIFVAFSCNHISPDHQKPDSDKNRSDSTIAFDADGYYFPVDTVKYKDYRIGNILIATTDKINSNGDKQISYVQIELVDEKTGKNREETTKDFEFRNKQFRATFKTKFIGVIELSSILTGKYGPVNDNVEEQETIVMIGTFTINKDYKKDTEFRYFAGE
jgi:hypothetical protein